MLDTLFTAYRLGKEYGNATEAARKVLADGGSLFQAIDAFAAATNGAADDALVSELKQITRQAISYGKQGASLLLASITKAEDLGALLVKATVRLEALGAGDEGIDNQRTG